MLKFKYWILKKIFVFILCYLSYETGTYVMMKIYNDNTYRDCKGLIDIVKTNIKNKEHETNDDAEEQPTDEIRIGFH